MEIFAWNLISRAFFEKLYFANSHQKYVARINFREFAQRYIFQKLCYFQRFDIVVIRFIKLAVETISREFIFAYLQRQNISQEFIFAYLQRQNIFANFQNIREIRENFFPQKFVSLKLYIIFNQYLIYHLNIPFEPACPY